MRTTARFRPCSAAAYVLLSLAPLNADSLDAATLETHGIVVANMDRSVRPGNDFYHFANGGWIKRTELPPDRSIIDPYGGDIYDSSNESTRKHIAGLIEEAVHANAPAGTDTRKIADLYRSIVNEVTIEAKRMAPLRSKLDAIAAIRDKHDLAGALGETLRADVDPLNNAFFHTPNLFGLWVAPDFNHPERYAPYLLQGGLEMPDREYYISGDASMRGIRAKYQIHVAALLRLAGFSETKLRARRIIELERAIAQAQIGLADEQDIGKANNNWQHSEFAVKAPGLDWAQFFRSAGLAGQASFIVWQPTAFIGESALVASVALDAWKDWLAFHLIEDYATILPKAFVSERFAFFDQTLSGLTEQRSRHTRAVMLVNTLLGDALGREYAKRYFPPETKAQIEAMVANLLAAYRRRIAALPWMDPATKAEVQAKLSSLYIGIGYPESWCDYAAYEVKADDAFGNLWRAGLFDYHRYVAHLGHPVDRTEWAWRFYPQSLDGVELPLQNAINYPAANFQPPYFDSRAPAAVNYGAIGAGLGHELSHFFDIEGSKFDSTGRARNWWKAADLAHFDAATASLAAQYDTYKPFAELAVNGKQTLAEDIADLAGLVAAYDAYHASVAGKPAPVQNGFTGDQQFFLSFAQSWASKSSDAFLREQVMTDTHAPERFRVATVRNLDAWYTAFDVQPGEKLYLAPADRVRIW
jgi:putative endopeptidase